MGERQHPGPLKVLVPPLCSSPSYLVISKGSGLWLKAAYPSYDPHQSEGKGALWSRALVAQQDRCRLMDSGCIYRAPCHMFMGHEIHQCHHRGLQETDSRVGKRDEHSKYCFVVSWESCPVKAWILLCFQSLYSGKPQLPTHERTRIKVPSICNNRQVHTRVRPINQRTRVSISRKWSFPMYASFGIMK